MPDPHHPEPLDGYDDWLDSLDDLPWWEALDRAYEREMTNRVAAELKRLREERDGT